MIPQTQKRTSRNSSKVNLLISFSFHGIIVLALVYFAAREGYLGKQIKKIAVEMVKEKPPEKPKEPEKPKAEPPKLEAPKIVQAPLETPKTAIAPTTMPSPATETAAAPVAAPAAVDVASFSFDGGKAVETSSDPVELYKGFVEYSIRSRWDRPTDIEDHLYVAEVEVSIDSSGGVSNPIWKKTSGDKRWDASVRQALERAKNVNRPPPPKFPGRVLVRFDVVATESISP